MPADLIKHNADTFLAKQRESAHQIEETFPEAILSDIQEHAELIFESLLEALQSAKKIYQKEKKFETVSSLQYIQISWMRTGLRTHSDLYRIDLYDQRWLSSFIECSVAWTPPFLFDHLKSLENTLQYAFERQSAAKLYSLDEIIYEVAERMNRFILFLLNKLIPHLVDCVFLHEKSTLKVYVGEFFDHSDLIYEGGT